MTIDYNRDRDLFEDGEASSFREQVNAAKVKFKKGQTRELDTWWETAKPIILRAAASGKSVAYIKYVEGGLNRLESEGFSAEVSSSSYRGEAKIIVKI